MNPKLHFQRFEFKYLITTDLEKEIRQRITPYLRPDPYVRENASGSYEVFSLYYDSPGFYYYQQKIDGTLKRKKVRLRTYRNNGEFIPYAFFEIKRKHDAIILKDRFIMSEDDSKKLVKEDDFFNTDVVKDKNRVNIVQEFEWEKNARSISPKLLVAYDRVPFIGKYNENFRVTFDKNIKAIENDNLFYKGNDMLDVSGNNLVMEIKFNGTLPFYVSEVIQEFDLERVPYSKYCNGIEICGSNSGISFPRGASFFQVKDRVADNGLMATSIFEN